MYLPEIDLGFVTVVFVVGMLIFCFLINAYNLVLLILSFVFGFR